MSYIVWTGLLLFLWLLSYFLGRWSTNFRKLVNALPSDKKLITQSIAAIDIGNFRFIYSFYEKGNNYSPFNKTYISMTVGIPFPIRNGVDNDSMVKESIKADLQDIIDHLQKDGMLTLFNSIVKNSIECDNNEKVDEEPITWTGQPFALEFPFKKVTPSLLIELQKKIVDIIERYNLQNYSWYVCNYNSLGKEYRYHKGNLLQSAVLVKHDFDKLYLNYKQFYSNWPQELDTSVSNEEYEELYNAASKNRRESDLSLREMTRITKNMFIGLPNYKIMITYDASDGFSINLSIPEIESACTYNIIASDGLWWFYSQGRFDNIYPISFDKESSACGFLLLTLQQYAGKKNADK